MRWSISAHMSAVLAISSLLNPVLAQCEFAKLLPDDGAYEDYFASGVSVFGETAIVGAYWDDDNGYQSGSAYVFNLDGTAWVQVQKLLASDGGQRDSFGWSVAVSGDVAVIGAMGADTADIDCGAAYVFRFDGSNWVEEAILVPDDGATGDGFGFSVAVSGNAAVIGSYHDDDNGENSGSAYVFRYGRSGWDLEQKLVPADGGPHDWFGRSVAVSGGTAIVGAPDSPLYGWLTGSAYVFEYDGLNWSEQQKLVASDFGDGDDFGWSVAISEDLAVVGAKSDDDHGADSGSAYVFRREGSSWHEEQKLLPSDGGVDNWFGYAAALSADTAVIGAPGYAEFSGSAHLFLGHDGSWEEAARLTASDAEQDDVFGWCVSLSDVTVLIGAYQDDDNGGNSGAAYVFDLVRPDCNDNGICDSRDIADGASQDCQPNNVPDECDIADGTSQDANGNGVPDECECLGDIDRDGDVDLTDLALLLADYGKTCE